jgi:hypothetical protein
MLRQQDRESDSIASGWKCPAKSKTFPLRLDWPAMAQATRFIKNTLSKSFRRACFVAILYHTCLPTPISPRLFRP